MVEEELINKNKRKNDFFDAAVQRTLEKIV